MDDINGTYSLKQKDDPIRNIRRISGNSTRLQQLMHLRKTSMELLAKVKHIANVLQNWGSMMDYYQNGRDRHFDEIVLNRFLITIC